MQKNQNRFFILCSLFLTITVTVILVLFDFEWYFYLVGIALAVITHILMTIQNKRLYDISKNKLERETFSSKKSSILWFLLKGFFIISVTILLVIFTDIYSNPNAVRIIFIYVSGYLTVKVVYVISLLVFRERG